MTLLREETAAAIAQIVEERFNQILQNTTTREEATERVIEIFDTTQPADSLTGTPPLKSRTTERRDSRAKSESRAQTEATAATRAEADIGTTTDLAAKATSTEESESREQSEATRKEERKPGGTLAVVQIATGIIVGLFLLWLLITVLRAVKTFSKPN